MHVSHLRTSANASQTESGAARLRLASHTPVGISPSLHRSPRHNAWGNQRATAMSASTAIRQFLVEAQRRVRCDAVAFTAPSRDQFYSHADPKVDAKATCEVLELSAD